MRRAGIEGRRQEGRKKERGGVGEKQNSKEEVGRERKEYKFKEMRKAF